MSDTVGKAGKFEPIHSAHAIEQVIFTVQITSPLNDNQLADARQIASQFRSEGDLPGLAEIQGITLTFGLPGAPPPPDMNGFALQLVAPDGLLQKELRIERTSLTYRTTSYTRWDAIWQDARRYFEALVPVYTQHAKLLGVALNYLDKFVWDSTPASCDARQLFRLDSKYLCPHIFTAPDLWHSHTGAFIPVGNNVKRLLNVNVNSLDEDINGNDLRTVSIATVLTDLLNQPGYTATDASGAAAVEFVNTQMFELHQSSKVIFRDLINDEMGKRISLIRE